MAGDAAPDVAVGGGDADTSGLGPHLRALTAPDGEFALVDQVVDGRSMRVYRRGPHTLREMLLDTAGFGDRPFSVYRGERLTYAEHRRLVFGLAAAFGVEYGLGKGDRVAIAMRNYPQWSPVFWATQVAGLVAVPLNAWWTGPELAWAVGDAGARLVVADGERAGLLAGRVDVPLVRARGTGDSPAREWADLVAGLDPAAGPPGVEVGPGDDSTILYTSGTTGRPKGAVHSHRNHVTNALNVLLTGRAVARAAGSAPADPGAQPRHPDQLPAVPHRRDQRPLRGGADRGQGGHPVPLGRRRGPRAGPRRAVDQRRRGTHDHARARRGRHRPPRRDGLAEADRDGWRADPG